MSDQLIADFRERAERGLDGVPALADLERRGRSLRRRRVAARAVTVALVVAAGGGVLAARNDADSPAPLAPPAAPPTVEPSTGASWEVGVRTRTDADEQVLRPGVSKVVYDGAVVRFDVTGPFWEWWGVGMGRRLSDELRDDYSGAVIFLPAPVVRVGPCEDKDEVTLLADPDPEHLRLEVDTTCPEGEGLVPQLHGSIDGESIEPGFSGPVPLDLWYLPVPGTSTRPLVVASWDLDSTPQQRAEQQALLDSMEVGSR